LRFYNTIRRSLHAVSPLLSTYGSANRRKRKDVRENGRKIMVTSWNTKYRRLHSGCNLSFVAV